MSDFLDQLPNLTPVDARGQSINPRLTRLTPVWSTLRFYLVSVVVAAVTVDTALLGWRFVTYRAIANEHAQHLQSGRSFLFDSTELRDWHERLQHKYEFAASRPWLAIEGDPPLPGF